MGKSWRLLSASLLVLSACDGQGARFFGGEQQEAGSVLDEKALAPGRWVTDAAKILDDSEEARLSNQLRQLEQKTGHQMVVVTVPTLKGQAIEEYAIGLASKWGVGRRGHNDGVMVLVAPNERQMRIEVGTGLEPVLTNSFAASVIEGDMIPKFKEGDYDGGVRAGVGRS
ncbi:MAG: TPM domain-containing protein [Sphingosinicella sp.]|nr:TPM domain-containing protein [Sphingosinicella sp.]